MPEVRAAAGKGATSSVNLHHKGERPNEATVAECISRFAVMGSYGWWCGSEWTLGGIGGWARMVVSASQGRRVCAQVARGFGKLAGFWPSCACCVVLRRVAPRCAALRRVAPYGRSGGFWLGMPVGTLCCVHGMMHVGRCVTRIWLVLGAHPTLPVGLFYNLQTTTLCCISIMPLTTSPIFNGSQQPS